MIGTVSATDADGNNVSYAISTDINVTLNEQNVNDNAPVFGTLTTAGAAAAANDFEALANIR
ncbi:hypothetical protein [Vibrio harveyi]|uniref:hypothetical protein n=1 Tax=Vibrio harveyi TaxID=669 RepID=UPI0002E29506|nr:hypothetical protein [Vibrio harveyi]